MGRMAQRVPILVGAGQATRRNKDLDRFVPPMSAMKGVVLSAAEDARCLGLTRHADAVHVVNILAWQHRDPAGELAEAVGASARLKEYTVVGGNNPQWLVNRAADNLSSGRSEVAILAGCEMVRSLRLAMRAGRDLGSHHNAVEVPLVGIDRPGTNEVEQAHYADRPVRLYPLIENALRAKEGLSLEEQRLHLGRFGATYSAVAAENPHAWFPVARSEEEVVTPTPKNRMIGWPYTKYLNAVMEVDQVAAVIMTTTEKARSLGIPQDRWVYLHGGQDAHDLWFVSERPDLADSPAIKACVEDALAQAAIELSDVDLFDFYSCFPCMPRLARHVLGIPDDDSRPMTLTGGLPYFGGPGNNYVMHSIAEAVNRCRAQPEAFALVTANGFYSTKHAAGIYSAQEPRSLWSRTPPQEFQAALSLPPPLEIDPEPRGPFAVDSYTVWHDRDGEPDVGILVGRTASGKRAWAQTRRDDHDLMRAMMAQEWVGKSGRIVGRDDGVNLVEF